MNINRIQCIFRNGKHCKYNWAPQLRLGTAALQSKS